MQNPEKDFAVGVNLLASPIDRDWLLVSGFSRYAIVENDRILEIGSVGQSQLVDKRYRPLKGSPNFAHVQEAMEQMSRFSQ